MEITDFLSRLTKVKGRNGSWTACCPAHEDRSPSMSVKELSDGRILIHCFGGCGTDSILGALGLTMGDLFPEPLSTHMPTTRAFSAADALRALRYEASVVAIAAADQAEGKPVDADRVAHAAGLIATATEFVCGQ
jgi:hypothetical protein